MDPDVRRGQARVGGAFDHLERRHHAPPGLAEVEHHPVAQPFHGPSRVLRQRRPLDHPRKVVEASSAAVGVTALRRSGGCSQ